MNKKISLSIVLILILIFIFYVYKTNDKKIPQSPSNTATYMCDGNKKLVTEYYKGEEVKQIKDEPPTPTGYIKLILENGAETILNQTISADGGRYANSDESFIFWDKGNGAMILENNQEKNYTGCIVIAKNSANQDLPQIYANSKNNFSIRLGEGYKIDETYTQKITASKISSGIKFTIPEATASGTNLGNDTYISVEKIPNTNTCTADMFTNNPNVSTKSITENGTDYSFTSFKDAGAGNRYEESIYAIPNTNPCTAIRYLVHYSVFENYPAGSIKEFDLQKLLQQFDSIRQTLVIK